MQQQANQPVHSELEVTSAVYLGRTKLPSGYYRSYYKTNADWAIASWICFKSDISGNLFYTPFLISRSVDGIVYSADAGGSVVKTAYTVEYNGELFYYSDVPYSANYQSAYNTLETDYIFLNEVMGVDSYEDTRNSTQAAKDLLDYYFGKI